MLLLRLIDLYQVILLVAALVTWISLPPTAAPYVRILHSVTEPVLRPLRKIIPQMGNMDITPIAAMIILEIISYILSRILF